jgi:ribonuclease Y
MMDGMTIALLVGSLAAGVGLGLLLRRNGAGQTLQEAQAAARKVLEAATREAEAKQREAALEVKDLQLRAREDVERETRTRREDLASLEKRVLQLEEALTKRSEQLGAKEQTVAAKDQDLQKREQVLRQRETEQADLLRKQQAFLEQVAGMTAEEAKRELMARFEEEARGDAARMAKRIEDESREQAERKAQWVIGNAIQRIANEYVQEVTVSVVHLPSDDLKGRIIGREGRNIRALESATGVDLIIDDTPEAILVSAFDPVRREVARVAIERLIADGRIHPARIEEMVEKVRKEIEDSIKEEGEKAASNVGIHNLHPELIKLLGRLKYRTSYGQNVLAHSQEVAYLCGSLAAELKLDAKLAKRSGLLHDIGKAVSHEVEGPHAVVGADLARKYGEQPRVVNAIGSHHRDIPPETVEAVLIDVGDALSAARPGARRESFDAYVKRLEKLEAVANSFKGVERSYAIQAGREIRIIVKPEEISDVLSAQISRDIARKIEDELVYPGQIKVTVIRESRFVEYAR